MIKAVIVDFDDTLCLTEEACFYLENEGLRLMGRPPMTRKAHQVDWGTLTSEAIKKRSPGVDVQEFNRIMDKLLPEWVASKKVDAIDPLNLAALDVLLQEGKKLYLLTSRPKYELEHILAPDHDLAKRISAFYYRDVMEFHKPDPRAFDLLLEDHQFERNECVYIGDSLGDAVAAKQAGLHFIACMESGLRAEEDFKKLNVDLFIQKFADLPSAVAFLEGQNIA
jgi:phosphoglycolate phosphatase